MQSAAKILVLLVCIFGGSWVSAQRFPPEIVGNDFEYCEKENPCALLDEFFISFTYEDEGMRKAGVQRPYQSEARHGESAFIDQSALPKYEWVSHIERLSRILVKNSGEATRDHLSLVVDGECQNFAEIRVAVYSRVGDKIVKEKVGLKHILKSKGKGTTQLSIEPQLIQSPNPSIIEFYYRIHCPAKELNAAWAPLDVTTLESRVSLVVPQFVELKVEETNVDSTKTLRSTTGIEEKFTYKSSSILLTERMKVKSATSYSTVTTYNFRDIEVRENPIRISLHFLSQELLPN